MLAILTTHPIQYQVPLWQALARDGRVPFEVWYLTKHGVHVSHDREFGKSFAWDLDMLVGYPHRPLEVADGARPGSFWKCRFNESFFMRLKTSKVRALWIQGWQVFAYWQAVWAAKQAGIEVWLRGESNDLAPMPFGKYAVKRVILGELFRRIDKFLYIGTANKRLYQKFGIQENRLFRAPYAVDNDRFRRQAEQIRDKKSEIRKLWNIPDEAFCVLFCGKFIPKKRPMDLIKAAKLFLNSNIQPPTSIHLLFVGSGELGGELRANCNIAFDAETNPVASGHKSVICWSKPAASFVGFLNQTEISKAYVAADCLVLPSDYGETWGLVVNEAMASGLPCAISKCCGSAEDLNGMPNQIFPCGDISALAESLIKIAKARSLKVPPPPSFSETLQTVFTLCSNAGITRKSTVSVL